MEKLGSEKQSDLLKATQQSRAEAIHQVDSRMKGFISHPLRKQHFTGSFLQSASPGPGSPLGQSSLSETAGGSSGHVGLLSPCFAAPGRSQKTSQPGPGGLQRAESLNSRRLHRGPARLRGLPPRGAGLVWVRPCQPGRVSRFQQIHRQYHLKLLNQEHVLH